MINEFVVRGYCREDISLIENYDKAINDKTQVWHCHHKDEIELNLSRKELIYRRCYFGLPANKLIFLTKAEHTRLHWTGRKHTQRTKDKIRNTRRKMGLDVRENNGMLGKHHSEESRRKIGQSRKGIVPWNKGRHYKGNPRSEDTKRKMSEAMKAYWERKKGAE